jgi:hypothetical protein
MLNPFLLEVRDWKEYVVAELFPSISDTGDDDGVEFCWRDEV